MHEERLVNLWQTITLKLQYMIAEWKGRQLLKKERARNYPASFKIHPARTVALDKSSGRQDSQNNRLVRRMGEPTR